jgi:hypothetical protein
MEVMDDTNASEFFASQFPLLKAIDVSDSTVWDPKQPSEHEAIYFLVMRLDSAMLVSYMQKSFFQYFPVHRASFERFMQRANSAEKPLCEMCHRDENGEMDLSCPSCGFYTCHECLEDVCRNCGETEILIGG